MSMTLRNRYVWTVSRTRQQSEPHQVDQLEEWFLEKEIPYISNDNFSQEGIFDYWNDHLSGHAHVKGTYPDVVGMWRQFHGCPGSGGGIERVFTAGGKQHDDLKKRTMDKTLESTLKSGMNTNYRLVMTKESSPMMKTHTGNGSSLRWVGGW
jgi:hypothetical protein